MTNWKTEFNPTVPKGRRKEQDAQGQSASAESTSPWNLLEFTHLGAQHTEGHRQGLYTYHHPSF